MAAGLEAHLAQSGAAELVHELQRMEIKMRVRMLVCEWFILHWSPSRCPDFTFLVLTLIHMVMGSKLLNYHALVCTAIKLR